MSIDLMELEIIAFVVSVPVPIGLFFSNVFFIKIFLLYDDNVNQLRQLTRGHKRF